MLEENLIPYVALDCEYTIPNIYLSDFFLIQMWTRYWVSYKNGQLILRLNERGGEPVDKLSLKHLTHIDVNPSDDIQEEVYLGKKHGMILTFGKSSMYLFGDNFKSVRFWKCLLEQQRNTSIKPTENKINKKYLWPVAQ